MCSAKDLYTLIEQSSNYRITCMQYSQKNFMRIIGNEQKNNGQNFWEILERIIGKISSIIGTGLVRIGFFLIKKRTSSSVMEVDCFSVQTAPENAPHMSLTMTILVWK